MKFLPIENITYKTHLKEDEIFRRLSDFIESERFGIDVLDSKKPYKGQINSHTFSIQRIIRYRNSFQPTINGVIERDFNGLSIKVKMRLHIFVIIFLIFWCGGAGLGFLFFLKQALINSEFNSDIILFLGMLLFAYILIMGAFKYESKKSIKDLQKIFEADIIKE